MNELERFGGELDFPEVAALDLRVVKVVQIVESPDLVAVAEETFADVRANEAGAAGDQKIHGRKLAGQTRSVERAGKRMVGQTLTAVGGCGKIAGRPPGYWSW